MFFFNPHTSPHLKAEDTNNDPTKKNWLCFFLLPTRMGVNGGGAGSTVARLQLGSLHGAGWRGGVDCFGAVNVQSVGPKRELPL